MSRLEETWHHPYGEAWWWQHHAVGMFFSGRDWETSQDRGKDERGKVQGDPCLERPKAHSQDNEGVAPGQVSECP